MGFKRTDAHARERMHTGARRMYGQEKHAIRGGLNSN